MKEFRAEGLDRLEAALASHVKAGQMPGLVALGTIAFEDPAAMASDTLVRIASLTKPITAAAAMILVEEQVLSLDEPVDRLLPELAGRQVLRAIDADLDDTISAVRPITVEDLLIFRLGFGSVMLPPRSTPIQRAEEELQLMTLGPPWPPPPFGPDEWMPSRRWQMVSKAFWLAAVELSSTARDRLAEI